MSEHQIINLVSPNGAHTVVRVVRETEKAILLAGNASEAWYPKAAIDADGNIADWFKPNLFHQFLFHAPFVEA